MSIITKGLGGHASMLITQGYGSLLYLLTPKHWLAMKLFKASITFQKMTRTVSEDEYGQVLDSSSKVYKTVADIQAIPFGNQLVRLGIIPFGTPLFLIPEFKENVTIETGDQIRFKGKTYNIERVEEDMFSSRRYAFVVYKVYCKEEIP